jgi:hypothetical protein
MPERIDKFEEDKSNEDIIAHKLEALLQEMTGQSFKLIEYHGTYEIDADTFFLTFTIEDDLFEIRSIEARGEDGLGGKIVRSMQQIASEEDCTLIASNVVDTAIGFWRKMGFEQTNIDGEYCWERE